MSLESDAMGRTTQYKMTEVNTVVTANGKVESASPGSETMACLNIGVMRAPGRPHAFSMQMEYADTTEEGERQTGCGESDGLIVPKKAGNAAGGKEATHGSVV
jgi:hypothetical protein